MSRLFFAVLLTGCVFASMSRPARCSDPTPQTSSIEIHAGKTRAPLSKYVYGQFIEHLGRCIYGGIWRKCWKTASSSIRSGRSSRRGRRSGRPRR